MYRKSNSSSLLGNEIEIGELIFSVHGTGYPGITKEDSANRVAFLPNSLSVDYQGNKPEIQFQCQLIINQKRKCAVLP